MLPSDEVEQVLCKPELRGPQYRGEVLIEAEKPIRHQVFYLPPIKPQVMEALTPLDPSTRVAG
jgi:hypothetical protein